MKEIYLSIFKRSLHHFADDSANIPYVYLAQFMITMNRCIAINNIQNKVMLKIHHNWYEGTLK